MYMYRSALFSTPKSPMITDMTATQSAIVSFGQQLAFPENVCMNILAKILVPHAMSEPFWAQVPQSFQAWELNVW